MSRAASSKRWLQLILGVLCMTMIANLQYGWTLFVNPIADKFGWEPRGDPGGIHDFRADGDVARSLRRLSRRQVRPRPLVLFGGILVGIAWVMNSYADSLMMLYVAQAIGGIGAGAVYGTCVGNALKWFPDRRGLAAGVTAAGFGGGRR